ncbi:MAG: DNA (cytosine-5-)-methyltransferase [Actinomycetota bacterium]|nr:DNA (cytosine-5-)-methyltransferase [Actinomycetota bacterium]
MIRVAGLFAGIGGIELGFQKALGANVDTVLLCESWDAAQTVLEKQFPGTEIHPDVRSLRALPSGVDVLTAGFPCTDLSQAGRTAGISGSASGLVTHVFEVLRMTRVSRRPWLLIENVFNMLALDNGKAMAYLVQELESLGYRWAYRTVDSRFTGVPQRRRRVILLASTEHDPRPVLFADDAGERQLGELSDDAFGFYWTEGRRGLGWAADAVPTLKGGSTVGIPSPPAIWHPKGLPGRRFFKPTIADAERLQGFPVGWTDVFGASGRRNGPRWKLVGNAVSVGVSRWVAARIADPGDPVVEEELWVDGGRWPSAAWGDEGKRVRVVVSEFPLREPYQHLLDVVDLDAAEVLSRRALAGFWRRLSEGNLGRHPGFREQIVVELDSAVT